MECSSITTVNVKAGSYTCTEDELKTKLIYAGIPETATFNLNYTDK